MSDTNSLEDILSLRQGKIVFQGEYSFYTPESIHAPHGTFTIVLSDGPSNSLEAFGDIKIITHWGTEGTTNTSLTYHGTGEYNKNLGYTTVNATGKGILTLDLNDKVPVNAQIMISLSPHMEGNMITVQGFGDKMLCVLTKKEIDHMSG